MSGGVICHDGAFLGDALADRRKTPSRERHDAAGMRLTVGGNPTPTSMSVLGNIDALDAPRSVTLFNVLSQLPCARAMTISGAGTSYNLSHEKPWAVFYRTDSCLGPRGSAERGQDEG